MKILYGIQATGNGHISRARAMANVFNQQQIKVDYLFSGRDPALFFDMDCFGEYQTKKGMTFVNHAGKIQPIKTIVNNINLVWMKELFQLDLSSYDLIINDFDPISAWGAKRQKIPSLGISNQASFLHKVPLSGNNWFDNLLINYFAPCDIQLGCHYYHFGFPILPPIIDHDAYHSIENNHHIIVYLPVEQLKDIIALLSPITDTQFHIFHDEYAINLPDHLHCHSFCRRTFLQYLKQSSGVIANCGFSLSSEALNLGKKLLVKPLWGQAEQESNAITLQLLNIAHVMKYLDTQQVRDWLSKPAIAPIKYPNVAKLLVEWIVKGEWQDKQHLCEQLWQQAVIPDAWKLLNKA